MTDATIETADRPRIICVDDEQRTLTTLYRLLNQRGYRVSTYNDPVEALVDIKTKVVSVVICDMRMPGMSGAELLAKVRQHSSSTYRVLITGFSDHQDTVIAVNLGKIHRYLNKPWDNHELLVAIAEGVAHHDELEQLRLEQKAVKQNNGRLEKTVSVRNAQLQKALTQLQAAKKRRDEEYASTLHVLSNVMSVNPLARGKFYKNVASLARMLGLKQGLSSAQLDNLRLASLLIDLGMLGLDPTLLSKEPGTLSAQEKTDLGRHPDIARLILSPAPHFAELAEVIGSQNEWYNGAGMPKGLKGDTIPLGARILRVARDFWAEFERAEAATGSAYERARRYLNHNQGLRYDPSIVQSLSELTDDQVRLFDESEDQLTVDQLESGMILISDLYNRSGLLLLSEGSVLDVDLIARLLEYQEFHDDKLYINAQKTPECGTTLEETIE